VRTLFCGSIGGYMFRSTRIIFVIGLLLLGVIAFSHEGGHKPYEVICDKVCEVNAGSFLYMIIEKGHISNITDYVTGKIFVYSGGNQKIDFYLFTEEQFELFKSGEMPEEPVKIVKGKTNITFNTELSWKKEKTYYLVFRNPQALSGKVITLFVLRIPKK
jgi:hypothetical protein